VTELETMIKHSVAADEWVADWDEVFRRAGRPRVRTRQAATIVAVAAAALALLLPGVGIGSGLTSLLWGSRGPGFELRAELTLANGRSVGTASLHTSRIFLAIPARKGHSEPKPFFVPRGHRPALPPVRFRWSFDLAAGARSAVLESRQGKVIARLCAPCAPDAHGTMRVRARTLATVFGRPVVVVETASGTARGTLRLTTPPRR
jgi:hypothetical protein